MKNQNPGGGLLMYYALAKINQSKFYLLLFLTFFSLPVSYAQILPVSKTKNQSSVLSAEVETAVRKTLKQNSSKIQFVENKGQEGIPQNVIAYFSSPLQTVFIEKDRLRIIITDPIKENKKGKKSISAEPAEATNKKFSYSTFSIKFKGSPGLSGVEKIKPFPVKRNYVSAANLSDNTMAESFSEIILKNIYNKIDLRLYSQEDGHLEFDWIVLPGGNASDITMKFNGQNGLHVQKNGSLKIGLGLGDFNMHLPESYYVTPAGKQKVPVAFVSNKNNEIRFKGTGRNVKKYPLVIDPELLWGTFFDGGNASFDEYLYGIEYSDDNQHIYCAGAANLQVSTVYAAALSTAHNGTISSDPDALIYALSKNGQFVTSITYLGGTGADVAIGISLSTSFVYVCGYTGSADFPVTKIVDGKYPAFDSVYHGNNDGFVAVFNPTLDSLFYCSYLGSDGADKALTIRAVADSTFYISLSAKDTLPVASPNYIENFADDVFDGNSEAWIAKFSSFNSLNFGTYVGGNNDDLINDFQVLSNGDIVFAGNTRNITEVNALIPNNPTGQEALYGRIGVPASGPVTFEIIDKMGGSNSDYAWGIYSLGDSVSIVVGQTNSSDFPLGTGTVFQNTRSGAYDGFMAKIYNNGGTGYEATYTGGSDDDILVSVRPVIVNNQIALLGWGSTQSTDLAVQGFPTGTFYHGLNAGGLDMMFIICDFNFQNKYYLSYVGGSANDYLGITGAPVGSNHLFYNATDSALYLGTTTHSSHTTQIPKFVGRGHCRF